MSVFLTSVKLLTDSTWQSLHSWLVWLRKRISPSINQRTQWANQSTAQPAARSRHVTAQRASRAKGDSIAVPILYRRLSRRQGHGTWPRSELRERRGRHRRPYIFIVYFSINWFHQNGYSASFWTGVFIKNSKQPNHQNGEIFYPYWGSASPKWNRLTAVENFLSPKWWFPVFSGKLGKLNYLLTRFTNKSSS